MSRLPKATRLPVMELGLNLDLFHRAWLTALSLCVTGHQMRLVLA